MVSSRLLCLPDKRHKYAHVVRADCFDTPDNRADDGHVHKDGHCKDFLLEIARLGVDVGDVDMVR